MAVQFSSDQISYVIQPETSGAALSIEEAIQMAPGLRQRSRELRAASKALKLRNADVILRASDVAMQVLFSDKHN